MRNLLDHDTLLAQEGHRSFQLLRLAIGEYGKRAERTALNLVHLAMQNIEIERIATNRFR